MRKKISYSVIMCQGEHVIMNSYKQYRTLSISNAVSAANTKQEVNPESIETIYIQAGY